MSVLWTGTVGTVSGSVKATCHKEVTLNSLTVPATAPCKLNTCSAVEGCSCGHTAGQDSRVSNNLSSDSVCFKCNMNML